MKRSTQIKLRQLTVITGIWLAIGFLIAVYDYLVIHSDGSFGPSPEYSFAISMIRNMGAGLIGALLGGSLLVFYVNVRYQDKPYAYTITAVSLSFILIVAIVTVTLGIALVPVMTGKPLLHPESSAAFFDFITDSHPIKSALVWSVVVGVTQLLLQINSKFGQEVFWDTIRGKYHTPKEEKRIFMFLDINSSTTIAEQLGDETYHELLKDFFSDITNPILENKGTIYQYVGDEVIVSWKYAEGLQDAHCIKCFYDVKTRIEKLKDKYLKRYGVVPSFKAGIHCGSVVAGEIGIIKRDITYSGDVLNTTSRIQGMCKKFKVDLIASADLIKSLRYEKNYVAQTLGAIKLRGKARKMELNTLQPLAMNW